MAISSGGGGVSRRQLVMAARGLLQQASLADNHGQPTTAAAGRAPASVRPYRVFGLQARHFGPRIRTPAAFFDTLMDRLRHAQRRVYLASLYIGPAANSTVADGAYQQEARVLQALTDLAIDNVNVRILLDHNRALRQVPLQDGSTVTSARACHDALRHGRNYHRTRSSSTPARTAPPPSETQQTIHLFSVLPRFWQSVLHNPLNEVGGVLHIKIYIVDDEVLLSGANLSQEYFTDRQDRYLWLRDGAAGMVALYADLVDVLCRHSANYNGDDNVQAHCPDHATLLHALADVLTKNESRESDDAQLLQYLSQSFDANVSDDSDAIVALAVPTIQLPYHFAQEQYMVRDQHCLENVLQVAAGMSNPPTAHVPRRQTTARISSAYLNPTFAFLQALSNVRTIFLTAAYESHGFTPKPKPGNKGKVWIPALFDHLARQAQGELYLYHRPGWTFHAKGLWLSQSDASNGRSQALLDDHNELLLVTHGSGNLGYRSEVRDLESNLYLVFPPGGLSDIYQQQVHEWNDLCQHALHAQEQPPRKVPWRWRQALPWIRSYF